MSQRFRVHDQNRPHFITCTVVYWIPVFCRDDYFRVLADSFAYCVANKGLAIHGYVIMPNHFHAICSQVDGMLSQVVGDVKKHVSKSVTGKLEEDGRTVWLSAMRRAAGAEGGVRFWDAGFHPEQVHSKPFFDQKLRYMHDNPARAGYVVDPCEWKYSSAGLYYRDQPSLVPVSGIEW